MRRTGAEVVARAEAVRQANQEAASDPEQVLAMLTRNNATFTERDLGRFLTKQLGEDGQGGKRRDTTKEIAAVLTHADLVPLHDRDQRGDGVVHHAPGARGRARSDGGCGRSGAQPNRRGARPQRQGRTRRAEFVARQAAAFVHAIGAGNLKLIEGRAGTGKSFTLVAIRDAHGRDGKRVIGAGLGESVRRQVLRHGIDGRQARLILLYLKTEASRTGGNEVELGGSGELIGLDVRLKTKHGEAAGEAGRSSRGRAGGDVLPGRLPGLPARLRGDDLPGPGQDPGPNRTYLYHTEHWRVAACYVALTRQRESAQVFVARETARDAGQLARQMGRGEVCAASIAWVAHEELATTRVARQAEAMGRPTTKSARSTPVGPLLKLGVRRAELVQQVPQAEKAEAAAFQQAEPAVTAELVQRQAKAGPARCLTERRQQEAARERQQERSRHQSRGMER